MRREGLKNFRDWLFFVLPIILSIIMCTNDLEVLAHLGFEKYQIKYADQCRMYYDTPSALIYYEKISEKDSDYAYYADLAAAEIYDESKNYDKAKFYYKKASGSEDLRILSSCLDFSIDQLQRIELSNNISGPAYVTSVTETKKIIVGLMNQINDINSNVFSSYVLGFPLGDDFQENVLTPDATIIQVEDHWVYDYTLVDTNGSLAYCHDKERLDYVTVWDELVSSDSFTTVTKYKYRHYVNKEEKSEKSTYDAIKEALVQYKMPYKLPISVAYADFFSKKS